MMPLIGRPRQLVNNRSGFPRQLPVHVIRIVARAIEHAWQVIAENPPLHLETPGPCSPEEDVYTEALRHLLDQMLQSPKPLVDGFTGRIFSGVARCPHMTNFNGTAINKQPDLVVYLADRSLDQTRSLVGVFIESKMVSTQRSLDKYTEQGLYRFVCGDYAWTMQAALMLGYQVPTFRTLDQLESRLSHDQKLLCCQAQQSAPFLRSAPQPLSGVSLHDRPWQYPTGGVPGTIEVWHMWDLRVPLATELVDAGAPSVPP